ncbi:MAG: Gfo/Idh/MocA family oxidoreductase [Nitrospirae bacterium]|nr:MAG: Gfo/Idh/MocA family oxidoreductase [Nitrospirota bacterium]
MRSRAAKVSGSFGIGLVGLGRHGSRYVRHLLEGIPGCRLAAVSRRDVGAGRAFAERHGLLFVPEWRELVTCKEVEAVVVVTPPALNREICLAAVRAGKPLLIEKPLALTVADAQEMVRAAREAGIMLMTAQTLRFTPVLARLRDRLADVGPLEYLVLTMRTERPPHRWLGDPGQAGGGVLLEIGIHLLDLIRFLTGAEAVEAVADLARRHTDRVEDLALARFRLSTGVSCFVEVSRVSGGRVCRVEAIGRAGQLIADVDRSLLTRIEGRAVTATEAVPDRPTVVTVLEAFAKSLSTGAPVPVSGEDGLRAVAMAEACYRAAREGRSVPVAISSEPA